MTDQIDTAHHCDTCYAPRRARFVIADLGLMGCWVCKLRSISPWWMVRIIDRFDRAGFARRDND